MDHSSVPTDPAEREQQVPAGDGPIANPRRVQVDAEGRPIVRSQRAADAG